MRVRFWVIQGVFSGVLFGGDYVWNVIGVKGFGGRGGGIWGRRIGLLVGGFVIGIGGIMIGGFVGSVIGEVVVDEKDVKRSVKVGLG
ncbi:DUF456 family protein [Bacillus pumilus]|uniref:DUF456 family protein n=1 Tax=Bacillus pumilus TaxID=1408 RepID=UPI0028CBAA12|nr:DUF456 family protein [Bacillus pumilus]